MESQGKNAGRPMTDLHCHLLPRLDDGAKTPQVTLEMAKTAASTGVRQIVCTPHCRAGDPGMAQRLAKIQKATEVLNYVFSQKQLPVTLYAGSELLCNDRLPETLEKREFLTLAGSRYLLIEFSFDTSLSRIEWAANAVKQAGCVPVLAHPERYTAVWRNPDCLGVWFHAGYVVQLDKDSILERFGSRCARTADWALRHGLAHVVASDAHNAQTRTTNLERVRLFLAQHYSPDYADLLLSENPDRIVKNKLLVKAN